MLLAGLLGGPEIEKARFSDKPNEEKMKQRYDSMGAFLESLGISPDNIENITEDFIVTVIPTVNGSHSVSAIIDLKRLRELKRNGENIATTNEPVIFIFDSSRIIGNPDPTYKEHNLGNIQKNCIVVNMDIQDLGSCWYHAVSSTVAVARNPDILGDFRESARVERNNKGGQSPRELSESKDKLPTEFETRQMLQLQKIAKGYRIGVINGQLTSKLIVLDYIRNKMEEFLDNSKLLGAFEERINTLTKRKEKEMGANFSTKAREKLVKYKNQLSREIGKITLEFIRKKYNTKAGLEGETFLQALEGVKVLYNMKNEFSKMLLRAEKVESGLLEIRKPVTPKGRPGSAIGGDKGNRTVSSATVAPSGSVLSSLKIASISSARGKNKSSGGSETPTTVKELPTASGVLGAISLEYSRESAKRQAILYESTRALDRKTPGGVIGK
jgi:hypothetical protein